MLMVDLYKQLKPRRCAIIIHYTVPVSLRVVDRQRHNQRHNSIALLLVNWATMAAPIANQNLRIEDSFKVHSIHSLNTRYVCDYVLYGLVCGILRHFEGFWTLGLPGPLII